MLDTRPVKVPLSMNMMTNFGVSSIGISCDPRKFINKDFSGAISSDARSFRQTLVQRREHRHFLVEPRQFQTVAWGCLELFKPLMDQGTQRTDDNDHIAVLISTYARTVVTHRGPTRVRHRVPRPQCRPRIEILEKNHSFLTPLVVRVFDGGD